MYLRRADIPADVLNKWYETFERRLKNDPTFWKDLPRLS
jgi:hypothetical protein